MDGSIQLFAPNHSGSLVAHLQELEFSTDVVGDSRDSSFHINASSVSLLALDDGGRRDAHSNRSLRGVAVWTVSHTIVFASVCSLSFLGIGICSFRRGVRHRHFHYQSLN